jgi:hypothetical protein
MPGKRSDKTSSLRSSTAAKSRRPDLLALFVDDKAYYRTMKNWEREVQP